MTFLQAGEISEAFHGLTVIMFILNANGRKEFRDKAVI